MHHRVKSRLEHAARALNRWFDFANGTDEVKKAITGALRVAIEEYRSIAANPNLPQRTANEFNRYAETCEIILAALE